MINSKMAALAAAVVLAVALAACGSSNKSSSSTTAKSSGPSATISGAGSTFAAPVYEQWASELKSSGLTVNYQAVGSGAGITSLASKTVDFGASDPPLKPADQASIAKNGSPAIQIPMFLGAITVSYNVPGLKTGLKLEGATIAEIFLGKIKTWNAAQIAKLNPGVTLPSTAITVIHRSDSSGTTAGFTGYLTKVDPEWASKVGEGKTVQWPTGTGAKGNAGVAGVGRTDLRRGRLRRAGLRPAAQLHGRTGEEQGRQLRGADAAVHQRRRRRYHRAGQPRIKISDPAGEKAYPITSQTFIVVNKDLCKAGVPGGEAAAKGVARFLAYGLGQGQAILSRADYAALPAEILAKSKTAAGALECNGAPLGSG